MSGMPLCFVDGYNLELLLNSIVTAPNIQKNDIKILTKDSFTKELVDGHSEYNGIQVETSIIPILNFLADSSGASEISDLISESILAKKEERSPCIVDLRFASDEDDRRMAIKTVRKDY